MLAEEYFIKWKEDNLSSVSIMIREMRPDQIFKMMEDYSDYRNNLMREALYTRGKVIENQSLMIDSLEESLDSAKKTLDISADLMETLRMKVYQPLLKKYEDLKFRMDGLEK